MPAWTVHQIKPVVCTHHDQGRQGRGCSREEAERHNGGRLVAAPPQERLRLLHLLPQGPRLPLALLGGRLCMVMRHMSTYRLAVEPGGVVEAQCEKGSCARLHCCTQLGKGNLSLVPCSHYADQHVAADIGKPSSLPCLGTMKSTMFIRDTTLLQCSLLSFCSQETLPVAMLTARAGLVGWGGEGRGLLFFSPLDCQGSLKAPLPFWVGLGAFTGSPCMSKSFHAIALLSKLSAVKSALYCGAVVFSVICCMQKSFAAARQQGSSRFATAQAVSFDGQHPGGGLTHSGAQGR